MPGEIGVEVRAAFWNADHQKPISKVVPVVIRHGQGLNAALAARPHVMSSVADVLQSMLQGEVDRAWSSSPLGKLKVAVWGEPSGGPVLVVVQVSLLDGLLPSESPRRHDHLISDLEVLAAMEEVGGSDAVMVGLASMVGSIGQDDGFVAAVGLAVAAREDKDKQGRRVTLGSVGTFEFGPASLPQHVDCKSMGAAEVAAAIGSIAGVGARVDPARPDTVVVEQADGTSYEVKGLTPEDEDKLAGGRPIGWPDDVDWPDPLDPEDVG